MLRVLDLFSGIGGFSLGLERTGGFKTIAFCEIDPYCQKVLAKHWPGVPIYSDVRELTAARLAADGVAPDILCGGFPCQDLSSAGKRAGIEGAQSGLWSELARLIGDCRPRYAIVENVAALLNLGMERVLWDLAQIGYDATWDCIPASAVGAPHRRDRVWIVCHPNDSGEPACAVNGKASGVPEDFAADPAREQAHKQLRRPGQSGEQRRDAMDAGKEATRPEDRQASHHDAARFHPMADAERRRLQGRDVERAWAPAIVTSSSRRNSGGRELWEAWRIEPDVGRVAYGVPAQMDRLRSLGNAVVPQIPELIGRAILKAEEETTHPLEEL